MKTFKDQVDESDTLRKFYTTRNLDFESEREKWYDLLGNLRVSSEYSHRLDWENRKRQAELDTIKRACQEVTGSLLLERQASFNLKRENDELRIKQREDRRKILDLQAESNSIEQFIEFQRDQAPGVASSVKAHPGSHSIPKSRQQSKNAKKRFIDEHRQIQKEVANAKSNATAGKILRTIKLPNQNVDALRQEVEATLIRMAQMYRGVVFALRQKRSENEEALRQRFLAQDGALCELIGRLQKSEEMTYETARDFLQFTQLHYAETRKLQEENEALRSTAASERAMIAATEANKQNELKKTKKLTLMESDANAGVFKRQAQAGDEHLKIIQEQYAKITQIYEAKVQSLRSSIEQTQEKHRALELRRNLQIEGYGNDISQMKHKLGIFQEYIEKLRALLETRD